MTSSVRAQCRFGGKRIRRMQAKASHARALDLRWVMMWELGRNTADAEPTSALHATLSARLRWLAPRGRTPCTGSPFPVPRRVSLVNDESNTMIPSPHCAPESGPLASPSPANIRTARRPLWRRLAIGVLSGVLACSAMAHGTWSKLTTSGPAMSVRSAPAAAAIGPNVYLFGGVFDDFRATEFAFFNDLHRFDTRTNAWVQLAPVGALPPARAFAAGVAVAHRHLMLVFGGATYPADNSSVVTYDDLWAYDVRRNEWEQLRAKNPGPTGRVRPSMWQMGDRTYVFGGLDASFRALNDLWAFDLTTRRWTLLIPDGAAGSPPARVEAYAGADAVLGKLTVFGGEAGADAGFALLGDTWQFDLLTSTWSNVTPPAAANITSARYAGAAAQIGPSLYVQGGDLPGGASGCGSPFPHNVTSELWHYSLLRRIWEQIVPAGDALPRLKRTVAATVGTRMYVFGGFDFACTDGVGGQVWNDRVYSYDPADTPLLVPALPVSPGPKGLGLN